MKDFDAFLVIHLFPFTSVKQRLRYCVMTGDIIGKVELHIREIVRIRPVVDIGGGELHKLNELVGRTSK